MGCTSLETNEKRYKLEDFLILFWNGYAIFLTFEKWPFVKQKIFWQVQNAVIIQDHKCHLELMEHSFHM